MDSGNIQEWNLKWSSGIELRMGFRKQEWDLDSGNGFSKGIQETDSVKRIRNGKEVAGAKIVYTNLIS